MVQASPAHHRRVGAGPPTTVLVLGAAVVLIAMMRVDPIGTAPSAMLLVLLNAAVILAALPGTLVAAWSATGRVVLWSASGWCLMLLVGGIFSFGFLMTAPLALIAAGLVAWPPAAGQPAVTWPDILAHLEGFAVPFVALIVAMLAR